ncbi:testis-specific protein 10 [Platysternon megacephalum]|uniref:Testis-specific protein 10 n=1 Tax=Platysternon megacephalum TaxID=55544 RepID=A0A4D9EGL3_9SAUR|nr:testis-specific protein 10 [Platysternon megacephalum]
MGKVAAHKQGCRERGLSSAESVLGITKPLLRALRSAPLLISRSPPKYFCLAPQWATLGTGALHHSAKGQSPGLDLNCPWGGTGQFNPSLKCLHPVLASSLQQRAL